MISSMRYYLPLRPSLERNRKYDTPEKRQFMDDYIIDRFFHDFFFENTSKKSKFAIDNIRLKDFIRSNKSVSDFIDELLRSDIDPLLIYQIFSDYIIDDIDFFKFLETGIYPKNDLGTLHYDLDKIIGKALQKNPYSKDIFDIAIYYTGNLDPSNIRGNKLKNILSVKDNKNKIYSDLVDFSLETDSIGTIIRIITEGSSDQIRNTLEYLVKKATDEQLANFANIIRNKRF